MAKFALECPYCATANTVSFFNKMKGSIKCGSCGEEINIKTNRLASRKCRNCDSVFLYDQLKGIDECPVCHSKVNINELKRYGKLVSFPCSQCGCIVQFDKNTSQSVSCPVCDCEIDVKKEIERSRLVSDTGLSVIKYEGDNDTFIWKHPIEDFNFGSQLIVHESQEAVFFLDGQALDTFGPGRYSLETENLPILKRIQDFPTGKQNPFHAEIYFINKTVQMSLLWGTQEKVRFIEPSLGVPLAIGAFGEMNLQVSDSRKLLIKLVGTTNGIAWGNKDYNTRTSNNETRETFEHTLRQYFNPLIQTVVKSNLVEIIKDENIDILDIDSKLGILSQRLGEKISIGFEEYGLFVPQFYINSIDWPNDKNFETIKKLRTELLQVKEHEFEATMVAARRKVVLEQQATGIEEKKFEAEKKRIEAQAEADKKRFEGFADAEVMRAQGYNQKDVIQADVQKAYAEGIGQMGSNGGGASGTMTDVLGLGIGLAAMGQVGETFKNGVKGDLGNTKTSENADGEKGVVNGWTCVCGHINNTGKFCSECGRAKPEVWDCTACGAKGNKGKFCSECGRTKPALWDCSSCGARNNKGSFCSECGKRKEDVTHE